MKKAIKIILVGSELLILCLFLNKTEAKSAELDFSGYFYNLPAIQKTSELFGSNITDKDYFLADISRLRFTPVVNFGMNTQVHLDYEINTFVSDITIPGFAFTNIAANRQAVDLNWNLAEEKKFQANHFIDRLFIKQFFDWGELVFGRQRISWGVGRIWQPTDLFNQINPANFSKFEKDGADAISSKLYLGRFTDLELVVNFREMFEDYNYGARFRTNFNEFDVSALAGHFDKRVVAGGDFAGNLFDAGIRGELMISADKFDPQSNFYKALLGIDYQFNSKLYGLLEYKHNGEGSECKLCYDLEKLGRGEIINLGLDYLAAQATYQLHELWNLSLLSNTNLNDESGFVSSSLSYDALQNLYLSLSAMYFYGDELDEYWYYSSAGYLTLEYYF